MSKQLATIISDWDTQTDQMVQQLHQARDKHVCWFMLGIRKHLTSPS